MAIVLTLFKKQTNTSGQVPLKRGDDWKLDGQVIEKYARFQEALDLTGCSATAFFEASTGGVVAKAVTLSNASCGIVEIDVASTGVGNTSEVALSENGTTIYCTIQHPSRGLITADMEAPVVEVRDRGFVEP